MARLPVGEGSEEQAAQEVELHRAQLPVGPGQDGLTKTVSLPGRVAGTRTLACTDSWAGGTNTGPGGGVGQPIVLALYGMDGEAVAVPLLPAKALKLAQELLTRGVAAIKADPEAPWAPE